MKYHEKYDEHFIQFLLNNAKELNSYLESKDGDFYTRADISKKLFNNLLEELFDPKTSTFYGATVESIVTSEDAVKNAIELYEKTLYSRYELYLRSVLKDKVEIIAKSKEEAVDIFLNDMVKHSKLVEEIGDNKYYSGTDIIGFRRVE